MERLPSKLFKQTRFYFIYNNIESMLTKIKQKLSREFSKSEEIKNNIQVKIYKTAHKDELATFFQKSRDADKLKFIQTQLNELVDETDDQYSHIIREGGDVRMVATRPQVFETKIGQIYNQSNYTQSFISDFVDDIVGLHKSLFPNKVGTNGHLHDYLTGVSDLPNDNKPMTEIAQQQGTFKDKYINPKFTKEMIAKGNKFVYTRRTINPNPQTPNKNKK